MGTVRIIGVHKYLTFSGHSGLSSEVSVRRVQEQYGEVTRLEPHYIEE